MKSRNDKKRNDFCIFILTHGRPDKVLTWTSLKRQGCTYPVYFIIDNEDKERDKYIENYGQKNVIVFDKKAASKTFDEADNFDNRKCVVYARNACFEIAKKLGFKYFLQLDDDYTDFRYKFNAEGVYGDTIIHKNIDRIFEYVLEYYINAKYLTLSLSQGGDFIGGWKGSQAEKIQIKRKAMNTFFCSTDRPFQFIGRINEDVNTYTSLGSRGSLIGQVNILAINQMMTQSNSGGMTETYLQGGTYIKSFYTVLFSPSCTKIRLMGSVNPRLHHNISWNNAVPKIIAEELRKK